jgi:hypothetical protein
MNIVERISPHAIAAHFIHESKGLLFKRTINHAPSVGDEIRMPGERYFKVTVLVWVYDEDDSPFQRLNIGITEANQEE